MPSGAKILLFILLMPFLAALGHDVYQSYLSDDDKIKQVKRLKVDLDEFKPSDVGWIWQKYHKESMEMAYNSVEPEMWEKKVNPILQMPSMGVGIVPFILGCVYLLLSFILGVWPFSRHGQLKSDGKDDFAVYKHAKSKTIKYSKK